MNPDLMGPRSYRQAYWSNRQASVLELLFIQTRWVKQMALLAAGTQEHFMDLLSVDYSDRILSTYPGSGPRRESWLRLH